LGDKIGPVRRAVFLDRDGTINEAPIVDGGPASPLTVDQIRIPPDVERGVRDLRRAGFELVVVTNQPNVPRGVQTREEVEAINRELGTRLGIDHFYVCWHDDEHRCNCRKPKPGLLLTAARDLKLDVEHSFIIGDRGKDAAAGKAAGTRAVLIDHGYAGSGSGGADARVKSFDAAARWILAAPRILAAVLILVCAPACSDPEKERLRTTTQATYDPATGKLTRLTADLNKDGKIDAWTYMDGTKVLRTELDADQDGKIERWEFHGGDGKVVKVAISREKNGKPDAWLYPAPDGKVARAEMSSEQDEKKIDRWEWYEGDQIVRAEEDASGDGKVDKWELFANGVLASVELDEDYDGRPDRRLNYGAGGRLISIESEPDGRGGYRIRVATSDKPIRPR
jgi:D-glycero-D-manno-heptose 1,7-bisphosphate phosphatase